MNKMGLFLYREAGVLNVQREESLKRNGKHDVCSLHLTT